MSAAPAHAAAPRLPDPDAGTLSGELTHAGGRLPVQLSLASGRSLFAAFEGDAGAALVEASLSVKVGGEALAFGRCRLLREELGAGARFRLIFLDDVYDCRALFAEGKRVSLKGFLQNLPLVLEARAQIQPAFREYVAATAYDLAVYRRFLDEQDRLLQDEPSAVLAAGQEAILRSEKRGFFAYMDGRVEELSRVTRDFDRAEHERHGSYLRRVLWDSLLTSEIHRRTNLKPRGYAGDAEMMELLYENRWAGRTLFSKLLHKHAVEQPAAQAVRNRRQLIARQLTDRWSEAGGQGGAPVRALSVACGPAWELRDLFQVPQDAERLHLTLLDQDPAALDCARACVAEREAALGRALPVAYVEDSVRTMLRTPRIAERFGHFDFIYSMGLFDYLTPPVARAVVTRLFELLAPGGRLVVGNYHVDNPSRWYMAYWLDWTLYYRTEEELLALASKLEGQRAQVAFDASGCQMFLTVDKDR